MKQQKPKKIRSDRQIYVKRLVILAAGPLFYGLFRLAFVWPKFTEKVYSAGVYRGIGQVLSTATGILPFSLGEVLLYAAILFAAAFLIVMAVHAGMARRDWWRVLVKRLLWLLCALSVIYALFAGLWGFNYARQPLAQTLGIDASPAAVGELEQTCAVLAAKAAALRETLPENEDGVFAPEKSKDEMMRDVTELYQNAADKTGLALLGGSFGRAKPVLWSFGLSQANITGIYFPFTGEANVNADAPMLMFAATCLHEAAHQRGFAREDEANFLAYYTASYADDDAAVYSGTMLALVVSMNRLAEADRAAYDTIRAAYSDGMNADLLDHSAYWAQFAGPVAETSEKVNDTFLKSNRQEDGVKSYGRMVDLLIGLWRSGELK